MDSQESAILPSGYKSGVINATLDDIIAESPTAEAVLSAVGSVPSSQSQH
ncbi:hypothetical protein FOMPIDRAFT_93004 [Fomitopsis schrenkii]|uniref:Uncharacterized protein n=1 Tax=Fomitopsis schrenkii TaxID=2126942 RepID=S8E0J3_FOMSC|nr:hypothetical protein FOMPIDRAFT_93004 [Fomitopsis schrenkii]